MGLYKKVGEVEAYYMSADELPENFREAICVNRCGGTFAAHIHTPEGNMTIGPTDWIARDIEGNFYPIKDSVFKKTYEPVKEDSARDLIWTDEELRAKAREEGF